MDDTRLAEIRERWAAVTPGPWTHDSPPGEVYALSDGSEIIASVFGGSDGRLEPNSDAIAAAPADVAELLAEVVRLRDALASAATSLYNVGAKAPAEAAVAALRS